MERLIFPLSEKEAKKQGIRQSAEENKNALFPTLLRELRNDKGVSQAGLAEEIGVTKSTIGLYETGDNVPDIKTLAKIAKYFNVQSDYLLGLSDNKTTDPKIKEVCAYTGLSDKAVEVLHASKTSSGGKLAPGELSKYASLLIEDSEEFDHYQEEFYTKQGFDKIKHINAAEEYDKTHAEVLVHIGWCLYNPHFLKEMIDLSNMDESSSPFIEWLNEMSEDARMAAVQKRLLRLKGIFESKKGGEPYATQDEHNN